MNAHPSRRFLGFAVAALAALVQMACNMTAGMVPAPRTPIEQLLLTQSLFRSLDLAALPLIPGESVTIETAWPPTHSDFEGDQAFAQAVITSWFAHKGAVIVSDNPSYHIRVLLHAFGLDKKDMFIGLPPIQSAFFPIALPELTIYRNLRDRGYARLSIDVYDSTGRLIGAPAPVEAAVLHQRYTLLFVFSWKSTDLMPPPL